MPKKAAPAWETTGAARRESLRRILGALPRLRVCLKKGRTEERPINGTMISSNGDQSDAGDVLHSQPLAKRDHGKDCDQHHTQFVEWSASGIAEAEGAEMA